MQQLELSFNQAFEPKKKSGFNWSWFGPLIAVFIIISLVLIIWLLRKKKL